MNHMALVLFDIDGTLIPSGSVRYWKELIQKHFNIEVDEKTVYRSGKTDREILAEFLQQHGISNPESDPKFKIALKDIGRIVEKQLETKKLKPIPHTIELIQALKQQGHTIGLLTGNTTEKARSKLQNAGLWDYFETGAFGDQTKTRNELLQIALENAHRKKGTRFSPHQTIIIGDTVRDIAVATNGGAISIAVATGKETLEQLKKTKPDYAFNDFSKWKKIVEVANKTQNKSQTR